MAQHYYCIAPTPMMIFVCCPTSIHTRIHTLSLTHTRLPLLLQALIVEGGGEMRDKDRDTRHELMDILDMSQVRVCCSMLHCVLQCVAVCVAVCRSVLHYVREIQIPGIS